MTGLIKPESGEVIGPDGNKIALFSPSAFIETGLGNIPEDRNKMGLVGDMTIAENLVLKQTNSERFSAGHGAWLKLDAINEYAEQLKDENDIRCTSVNQTARSLSGGNQQKVIFGRWILTQPDVLLLDEPTRGIDVGAKYEIYQLIQDLAKQGKAVVMVSSEMPELLGVCNRIVVMSGGRVAGEVDADNTTQEEIMTLAAKYA